MPDLRLIPPPSAAALKQIVIGGLSKDRGMPPFPDMKPADADAIYAYIINEGWNACEAQEASKTAKH